MHPVPIIFGDVLTEDEIRNLTAAVDDESGHMPYLIFQTTKLSGPTELPAVVAMGFLYNAHLVGDGDDVMIALDLECDYDADAFKRVNYTCKNHQWELVV
jgi:hypothetical protein